MKMTRIHPSQVLARATLGVLPVVALSAAASAQLASPRHDEWRWTVTPYVWATDVGVDVDLDGRNVVDETIPVEDLVDDIDMTFQGRIEAKTGHHAVMLDLFYVSMSDDVDSFALPHGSGTGEMNWKMDMTIADIAGVYDPSGEDRGFSFLYGTRVIHQSAKVDATFTTTSGTTPQSYDSSETTIDALAGVRFSHDFTDRWRFQTQLDASTGGTDYTWSAFPSLSYSFSDGRCALVAGYRSMTINFEDKGGLESEMTLAGPVLGFRMTF